MKKDNNKWLRRKLKLKKNAPEIFIIYGLSGLVASTVLGIVAYKKSEPVIKEFKEKRNKYKEIKNTEDELVEVSKNDIIKIYAETGLKLSCIYGPVVLLEASSVYSILKSHNMLKKENIALTGVISGLRSSFDSYRKNVIDRYGEDVDKELRYNVKSIEETSIEDGKEVKKEIKVANVNTDDDRYVFVYDSDCGGWDANMSYNIMRIKGIESYINSSLSNDEKCYSYFTLSKALEEIGIREKDFPKGSLTEGWIFNPNVPIGDDHVKFDIYPTKREKKDYPGEYEDILIINLNCDGDLSNYI